MVPVHGPRVGVTASILLPVHEDLDAAGPLRFEPDRGPALIDVPQQWPEHQALRRLALVR